MNAYVVRTKDMRSYVEPVLDDGSGPSFPIQPIAPVIADTPAQAKKLFLDHYTSMGRSGVETDDYPNLRVRLLMRDVSVPFELDPGVVEERGGRHPINLLSFACWLRIHEVYDHDGKRCDCGDGDE